MNPYFILGIEPGANDAEIRQVYLAAVKDASPDTHPERFQAISHAYAKIKDETARHQFLINDKETPGDSPVDAFLRHVRYRTLAPLDWEAMKDFLKACAKS
ncbi:MAG TPA: J domain-containing protein [Chthoniobacterales bacterium]